MELTVENLRKIQRIDQEQGNEIKWKDLIELFGKEIYFWEYVLKESDFKQEIKIELNSFNLLEAEYKIIIEALKFTKYSQQEAAMLCGITSRAINYKISNFKITNSNWKKNI